MGNYRIFVEKKTEFRTEAKALQNEIIENLKINLVDLRIVNIYDIFDINKDILEDVKKTVLSEIQTDVVSDAYSLNDDYLAVEFLEGQFDQRAESAKECILLKYPNISFKIRSGKVYVWKNRINEDEKAKLRKYLINEVEAKEKDLSVLKESVNPETEMVKEIDGFIEYSKEEIKKLRIKMNLAMSDADLEMVHDYFRSEKRNPTETEIRVLDTYWSDHCRHQTFETVLDEISFQENGLTEMICEAFSIYLDMRKALNRDNKPITLMDMATINSRYEYEKGNLDDLEKSEENNACSIFRECTVDGHKEKYLIMFKNETHNHPTEIEPFGGASTCIGGAIRDPLSGRSYVYQAMRITGAGDITVDLEHTLKGKLPQRVISKGAANGYSSYGNQVGLATGYVEEIYHPGYVAKRLEVGAVVGSVKADSIRRSSPEKGDLIILLGGRTGRDGIGGATGSSKAHDEKSVSSLSSEVQKGNAPEERKIQRLFRNEEARMLIKKSNDFGAGGVSVAIGELADGIDIFLDKVPVKYTGLNGTELAISESQERMAVVVEAKDAPRFLELAHEENIEANVVAHVTDTNRLVMKYKGKTIVDISRDFIATNGATFHEKATIGSWKKDVLKHDYQGSSLREKFLNCLSDLNVSSQKGLVEMFDSTIGAGTVLMPYGGKYQNTHVKASVCLVPGTETATVISSGFNPYISNENPFLGSIYAVIESLSKLVSVGASFRQARFSFQEYFPKLGSNKNLWGSVTESLLGSIWILKKLNLASIGGKDSMSGTFNDLEVPKTLISFALTTEEAKNIISPEFKKPGHNLYLVNLKKDGDMPNIESLKENFDFVHNEILKKNILSCNPVLFGGVASSVYNAACGNRVGFDITYDNLFDFNYGGLIIETEKEYDEDFLVLLGKTASYIKINGIDFSFDELEEENTKKFRGIYPTEAANEEFNLDQKTGHLNVTKGPKKEEVKVFIPAFPGTNCDYDTYNAFKNAGGNPEIFVFKNTYPGDIEESIQMIAKKIHETDILVLSGGFSLGDEPDGSGKFIANVLQEKSIKKEIEDLLQRKGLILGICNGFQALIKSGLLPYGNLDSLSSSSPTLFRNNINRHVSKIVYTKVTNNESPWLSSFKKNEIHAVAVSHGEGKFVCNKELADELFKKGMVAFQYVDENGNATMDPKDNPNGSYYAIEGITSYDGLILGKMGHSERSGKHNFQNICGNKNQDIFKNAIMYFKKEN